MEDLKKNVHKNYIFTFINNFNVTSGIWMLFLASRGLSLFEIGIMESIFHITSFTMEIPTGMIADLYGRKFSRLLGRLATVLAFLIMLFSHSTSLFALSFIIQALGYNLESGAGEALIYDSMKEIGEENNYIKVKGKTEVFFQIASVFSLLLGGYLGTLDYRYVYITAIAFSTLAFLEALTFKEPTIGKVKHLDSPLSTFKNQLKESFTALKMDKRIVFLIISAEIFATFVTTEFFYIQNLLKSQGQSEFQIGLLLSVSSLAAAVVAVNTYKLELKFKFKKLLIMLSATGIAAFWGMTTPFIVPSFILITMVESIMFIVMGNYINKLIKSEQRATLLSLQSMAFSLFMIVIFPIVGKLGDFYGLDFSFIFIALSSTIALSIVMYIAGKKISI
jgi:MFS family permease